MDALIARVVDVHTESGTIDCVGMRDGRRFINVPVIGNTTGNTGTIDLPEPDLSAGIGRGEDGDNAKWNSVRSNKRDMKAIIMFVEGAPMCVGFVAPPLCELHFPDEMGRNARISRHSSDVYSWISKDADSQWVHPNGTHISLAADPKKRSLDAQDHDRKWSIKRNLTKVINFFAALMTGNVRKSAIKAHSDGKAQVTVTDTIRVTAAQAIAEYPAIDAPEAELKLEVDGKSEVFGTSHAQIRAGADTIVKVSTNGTVIIACSGGVTVSTPTAIFSADVKIDGNLVVDGTTATAALMVGAGGIGGEGGDL